MLHAALALLLFVAVLALLIWRPHGLSMGWPAAIGGLLAVPFGVVSLSDVSTVVGIVWDATITFVAVILISLVLDAVGFFEWAALHMARLARGSGHPSLRVHATVGRSRGGILCQGRRLDRVRAGQGAETPSYRDPRVRHGPTGLIALHV